VTRADPESPLRWTCKSLRKLVAELRSMGHKTSHGTVAELLRDLRYTLQANSKTREGSSHPDRNAQFEYLNRKVKRQLRNRQPAISVDTKKNELVGDIKNSGRELSPAGNPEQVRVHDFIVPELGRANPYGKSLPSSPRAPATGTRSNIARSPSSARTGVANPCLVTR
jgi:hypothetical protein